MRQAEWGEVLLVVFKVFAVLISRECTEADLSIARLYEHGRSAEETHT